MNIRRKLESECAQLEHFCARSDAYWGSRSWPDLDETADFLCCWLRVTKRKNWLIDLLQVQQSETDLVLAYLTQTADYPITRHRPQSCVSLP